MSTMTPDVRALGEDFRGELIHPGEPSYDDLRAVWNGSIDRRPGLIARCTGVADIRSAIAFARRTGGPVAVRGGGHSFPGHSTCDGGIVLDLSPLKGIRVDPVRRTARAQAGVLLGELDRETQAFGLADAVRHRHPHRRGRAHAGRRDRLADAQVRAEYRQPALGRPGHRRGRADDRESRTSTRICSGGSAVVAGTSASSPSSSSGCTRSGRSCYAGPVMWPMESSPELLRFYRDWITDIPDELTTAVIHRWMPDAADDSGRATTAGRWSWSVACYAGSVEAGERAVAPLKAFAPPLLDLCTAKPYRRPPGDVRPELPARTLVLHAGL